MKPLMTRLTDAQAQRHANILERLSDARAKHNAAVGRINALLAELELEIEEAADEYNEAIDDHEELADEVSDAIEASYDEQSDAWRESAAGKAHHEWMCEWRPEPGEQHYDGTDTSAFPTIEAPVLAELKTAFEAPEEG